ncbi:MAG: hypothetical protein ACOYKG_05195 [Ilumatobacteraceae bacterium]
MRTRSSFSISIATSAAIMLVLASCGGSSSSRQRNSTLADGPPSVSTIQLAEMTYPIAVAVDKEENLFTANLVSKYVTKVNADGSVDNKWGNMEAQDSYGIAANSAGDVYVASFKSNIVAKFTADGTRTQTISVGSRPIDIAFDVDQNVYVANNSGTVSIINPGGDVESTVTVGNDVNGIAVSKAGFIYVANSDSSTISKISIATRTVENTIVVGSDPRSVTVVPNGDVYVAHRLQGFVTKIDPSDDSTTQINIGTVYNVTDIASDSNGNVFVVDDAGSRIHRLSFDGTVTNSWAEVGGQPHGIAVSTSGVVYTANLSSNSISKVVPVSNAISTEGDPTPTRADESGIALTPTFGSVTRTADGFTVAITNFDATYTFSASANLGSVGVDNSTGMVTLGAINPDTKVTVTVQATRNGKSGSAEISGSSLRSAQVPMFGETTSTADGFTVPITNFDSDFMYNGSVDSGEWSLNNQSGVVTVSGLDPDTSASVRVTTSRDGYVSGTSDITASSLKKSNPAVSSSVQPSATTTPVPTSIVSSSTEVATSIVTSSTEVATTSSMEEVSTTSSAAPIVSPTDVVIAPEVVAIAATAAGEKTEGLVVSPKTTEVVCNTGCVAALLASTGVADGEVSVVIGNAAPVALPLDNHVKINVGSKDAVMKFIVTSPEGKETVVNVPVTHSSSVPEPAGVPSDSNTNLYLIIAGVMALLVSAGFFLRRKNA